jgi:ABC-type lipoprotein release transport system permease subunit
MKKNLLMAWRNLWRNRKRTFITIASIFFGVLIATLMSSMQEGSYSSMIKNVVRLYSGYIQIQEKDYWKNKVINNSIATSDSLNSAISQIKEITSYTSRLESFLLASSREFTKGSRIIGINPEEENKVTELEKRLKSGTYLRKGDDGVLLSSDLARYMNIEPMDTIVLIGQGYHGMSAAGKFPVRGIIKLPSPDLDKQTIYMDLGACQELLSTGNRITSIVVMVNDHIDIPFAVLKIKSTISSEYRVMTWDEMQPEILRMINSDKQANTIPKLILYVIIGFGILSTVMMMTMERRREMGVLIAIGMQRGKLAFVLFLEILIIAFTGIASGFLGSLPMISYFYNHPLQLPGETGQAMVIKGFDPYMYFSWAPQVFYEQVIIILTISLVISLYPVVVTRKLNIRNAIHS